MSAGDRRAILPLHNERHAPVGWIQRARGYAQHLVSVAAYLGHLIWPNSVVLHEPSDCIGPIGRQLPVGIVAAIGKGRSVCVAFDQELIGQQLHFGGDERKQLGSTGA